MSEREKKVRRKRATLNSVLVYVDEPQLAYFDTAGSAKIVAVAIPAGPGRLPFFAAEVGVTQWERYLREQVDLRYLFQYPAFKRWYLFDFHDLKSSRIDLSPISLTEDMAETYLPDAGFFSRSHTETQHGKATTSTQEFDVDGAWDLHDFSEFYARMSDVYAFYGASRNWSDPNTNFDVKRKTKLAFVHNWRGGSSYVNFFNELYVAQPYTDRLAVHSIQYASPGAIKVDGNVAVFSDIIALLADYALVRSAVRSAYDELYKYLSQQGYLRLQGDKTFLDQGEADYIREKAARISQKLNFNQIAFINEMSDNNALVSTKVLLAIVRRTEALFHFFAEGRVKLPAEDLRSVEFS